MASENQITPLAAKRQMSFLATFEKKFQGFRREMERLRRASSTGKAFGGRWPTEGLERTARSLVGAGAVYGLPAITDWARNFLTRLDTIRASQDPPSDDDLSWLGERIGELEQLKDDAEGAAKLVLAQDGSLPPGPPPAAKASTEPRDSKPFIAPKATTDPPAGHVDEEEPQPPMVKVSPAAATREENARAEPASTPAIPPSPPEPEEDQADPDGPAPSRPTMELAAYRAKVSSELRSLVLLAVKDSAIAGKLQYVLKGAGFEVKKALSLEDLSFEATQESPELVVIDLDEAAPGGPAALTALTRDPLTDFIPVLKIATISEGDSTTAIPKPVDGERLVAEARRLVSPDVHSARITMGLRDPNLKELLSFVNDELRTGVLDSALGEHRDDRFRIAGEGHLMAAIWGLVAHIRKAAAQGSRGDIRFLPATSGQMGVMALAEAEEVLDSSGYADIDDAGIVSLDGLRVVIADDDPEIRVVFDRVLSGAGMKVRTASDGLEALEAIRENPPDLIITDILMPGIDGWELCNRLRRDYGLRHLPVILLSWKEDFLERLRGLNVDADGFMLKEVDKKQILARAARVMKPRFVLQRQLGIHGDVTGRIERVGVMTILLAAVVQRTDCRVTFRESWNYFEADIRDGELVAVTRTGTDGSFSSGPPALERLLGTDSGRFAIIEAADTPRRQFKDGTAAAIQSACRRLNNMVAQVTDGALLDIAKVELDEDVLELYGQIMPPKLRGPLDRLIAGESPREIILSHETSPDALETLLLDLVRVGAISNIQAPPPDLTRAPIARDSARWKALGDGELAPAEEDGAPIKRKSSIPPKPPLRSEAMPLDDEEMREASTSSAPPRSSSLYPGDSSLPPEPLASPRGLVSRGWQVFAFIVLLALALSVYFNVTLWEGRDQGAAGEDAAKTTEERREETEIRQLFRPDREAPAKVREDAPSALEVAAEEADAPDEEAKAEEQEQDEEEEEVEQDGPSAEDEARWARNRRKRREREGLEKNPYAEVEKREKPEKKTPEPASAEDNPYAKDEQEKKPEKKAARRSGGTLVVKAPEDAAGPVRVKVDGKNRGTAPVSVDLSAGLHEVTFTIGDKRTMRMVSIKDGADKTITAKMPN